METKRPWAFIFMNAGSNVAEDQVRLVQADGSTLLAFGVATVEEACDVVNDLIETKDCSFVELCGAFDEAAAERVRESCGHRIPIGAVTYPAADRELFDRTVLGIETGKPE